MLRIERGIPRWGSELSEDTLPQEVGLDQIAVDFKKGCYVGQEVVSRIHSVGRVNRHLCGFVGDFDPFKASGATLLVDAGGQKAGRLTSAMFHPELRKTVRLASSKARRLIYLSPLRTKVVLALAWRNVLNFLLFPDENPSCSNRTFLRTLACGVAATVGPEVAVMQIKIGKEKRFPAGRHWSL